MLVEFSLKLLCSTIYGKNFQIYGVHIPRKLIDLRHFDSCSSPLKTRPQVLLSRPRQKEIIHSPRRILSKICFPEQQKGLEKTMICFVKIQSENMKMTWNIRLFIFCMSCSFTKCDSSTVL